MFVKVLCPWLQFIVYKNLLNFNVSLIPLKIFFIKKFWRGIDLYEMKMTLPGAYHIFGGDLVHFARSQLFT